MTDKSLKIVAHGLRENMTKAWNAADRLRGGTDLEALHRAMRRATDIIDAWQELLDDYGEGRINALLVEED